MKRFAFILCVLLMLCFLGCSQEVVQSDELIDTQYFTLTLPQSWRNVTVCQVIPDGDRYAIECYERQDFELNGTGKLCTIKLFADGEDFTVPGHRAYGILKTKKADFEVVALLPTEAACTPGNAEQFKMLSYSIDELVYSLEPKKGCEWLRPQWDIPNPPDTDEKVIEMQYYTVTIPPEWDWNYYDDIAENEDGTSTIAFYELQGFKTGSGGHLCSIIVVPHGEDYSFYPSYEWVGVLETPQGDFDIVVIFPTDVQFDEETASAYNDMYEFVDDLIYSIKPRDGIGMMMP